MAVVAESTTLSRSSRPPISLPPTMPSSSSRLSLFGVRGIQSLPGFKGLRIRLPLKSLTASSSSRVPKVSRRKTNIVCEAQKTALDFPTVTDTTWRSQVLNGDGPVLVEFWVLWCSPCRMLHPAIEELAQ